MSILCYSMDILKSTDWRVKTKAGSGALTPSPWTQKETLMSNNTITTHNVTSIFYGFLGGNLLSGSEVYDERESAIKYAESVRVALTQAYPGAEIEVDFQLGAEGCTPATLQPRVTLSNGDVLGHSDRGEIEDVELIASRVWEQCEGWLVEAA